MRFFSFCRPVLLIVAVAALTMLASCHKTCHCYAYDGTTVDYSSDEVDNHGGSCDNMRYQYGTRYYSLCEWEN